MRSTITLSPTSARRRRKSGKLRNYLKKYFSIFLPQICRWVPRAPQQVEAQPERWRRVRRWPDHACTRAHTWGRGRVQRGVEWKWSSLELTFHVFRLEERKARKLGRTKERRRWKGGSRTCLTSSASQSPARGWTGGSSTCHTRLKQSKWWTLQWSSFRVQDF